MIQLLVKDVYLLPEADAINPSLRGRDTAYVAGNGSVHVARDGYALTIEQKRLMIII